MSPLEFRDSEIERIEAALKAARWAVRLYSRHPNLWSKYLQLVDHALDLEFES